MADSVSIMGEVQMATSYRYDPDVSVEEYISRSGGTKEKADEGRIYVVKANGSIMPYEGSSSWFSFGGGTKLGPGDTIVVPLDTNYSESLELWSKVTGIIYNSAVAIAAINGI
jgi:protein involved in polysaccharide export with SLBB domain